MTGRFVAALAAFLAGELSLPAAQILPAEGWGKAEISRAPGGEILVRNVCGPNSVLHVTAEAADPGCIRYVAVSNRGDRLDFYVKEAFAHGLGKLVSWATPFETAAYRGRTCTFRTELSGPRDAECGVLVMGRSATSKETNFGRLMKLRSVRGTFDALVDLPDDYENANFRFDIVRPGEGTGPISLHRLTLADANELKPTVRPAYGEAKLLLHASFDGTADAEDAGGAVKPLVARGLSFVPGCRGQAVRVSRQLESDLRYAFAGHAVPARGALSCWVRHAPRKEGTPHPILSFEPIPSAGLHGSGRLWFGTLGNQVRADLGDVEDVPEAFWCAADKTLSPWTHFVLTWDEFGAKIYENGKIRAGDANGSSVLAKALDVRDPHGFFPTRGPFEWLQVGGEKGSFDGDIDELRLYDRPLSAAAVRKLYERDAAPPPPFPDYAKLYARSGGNKYELPATATETTELIETIALDEAGVARLKDAGRFRSVGKLHFASLDGRAYLETDGTRGTRFAIRCNLPTNAPLYCFEIDYPDNARRTMDVIVQDAGRAYGDFSLQNGVCAGDEYRLTNRMLTHRCHYWVRRADCALIVMGARAGSPAAVASVRIYRVKDAALPAAPIAEPAPAAGALPRLAVLFYEDPAIHYDFALFEKDRELDARDPVLYGEFIDRVAAYMKYCGLNMLSYPGAWYDGVMNDDYMPRAHPRDFLTAYYEKFDREGLYFMPTFHGHTMPGPDERVTRASMSDGSLHDTVFAIHATGRPNWGGWHGTPPNYNFSHPDVRAYIERTVMDFVRQGASHPSFKGVTLHASCHSLLWFGSIESGYNDYTVDRFGRETGVRIPVDRQAPHRGKLYADWILANVREKWIDWRCRLVADFYAGLSEKMRAVRPDLMLWFKVCPLESDIGVREARGDAVDRRLREAGFDSRMINARVPNAVAGRLLVPAEARQQDVPREKAREMFARDGLAGFYPQWKGARFPLLDHHDLYWEDSVGDGPLRLSGDWLNETGWRISTLNPSGRNALRHFSLPLAVQDVLGVSKGGFLVGFNGMEDVFVPWIRAFRALPAVVFDDVPAANENVRVRTKAVGERRYFYAVNVSDAEQTVAVEFPPKVRDLVSGESVSASGGKVTISLKPYELKSYAN